MSYQSEGIFFSYLFLSFSVAVPFIHLGLNIVAVLVVSQSSVPFEVKAFSVVWVEPVVGNLNIAGILNPAPAQIRSSKATIPAKSLHQ